MDGHIDRFRMHLRAGLQWLDIKKKLVHVSAFMSVSLLSAYTVLGIAWLASI